MLMPFGNRTLGFEKVFAIGFKGRTDKHDAITIASSLTDIDVSWSDAVSFDDVPSKAVPEGWNFTRLSTSTFGSWRAHLNVLQHIVDEGIQTALIMEDDTDWDWFLKDQLEAFSEALRGIQMSPRSRSPYGDSWDMIWPGHCRLGPNDDEMDVHFLGNDSTVPPVAKRRSLWRQGHIIPEIMSNDTRTVFKAHAGMCTFAYAVTYEGAQKLIASLSLTSDAVVYDVAMSAMCRQGHVKPFRCYGIYPPIFSSHRFAGSKNRDSDIQAPSDSMHPEFTFDIVYSTTLNAISLLSGSKTVKSQWPNDTMYPELSRYDRISYKKRVDRLRWQEMPKTTVKGVNTPR